MFEKIKRILGCQPIDGEHIKKFIAGDWMREGMVVAIRNGKLWPANPHEDFMFVGTLLKAVQSAGEIVPVRMKDFPGTHRCLSNGCFPDGDVVYLGDDGRVGNKKTFIRVGISLQESDSSDQLIECLLLPPE